MINKGVMPKGEALEASEDLMKAICKGDIILINRGWDSSKFVVYYFSRKKKQILLAMQESICVDSMGDRAIFLAFDEFLSRFGVENFDYNFVKLFNEKEFSDYLMSNYKFTNPQKETNIYRVKDKEFGTNLDEFSIYKLDKRSNYIKLIDDDPKTSNISFMSYGAFNQFLIENFNVIKMV